MSNKQAKAVLVKRKNVQEENEEPTFPALYQHEDGSIYIFTSKNNSICLIDSCNDLKMGECGSTVSFTFETHWKRLPSNKAVKIFNQ